jgi:hypothetical protein
MRLNSHYNTYVPENRVIKFHAKINRIVKISCEAGIGAIRFPFILLISLHLAFTAAIRTY